jgi:hypothetical protein
MGSKFISLLVLLFLIVGIVGSFAQENTTSTTNETQITQNTTEPVIEPISEPKGPVCSNTKCEKGCVKCEDNKCHEPKFVCEKKIAIEKFFPTTTNIGQTQVNILLRNIGNVDLTELTVEITGDGITTLDKIQTDKIVAGDKDYAFTKINASKGGVIDIIIKLYAGNELLGKAIEQITVVEEKKVVEVPQEEFNATALMSELDAVKQRYREAEKSYQDKKAQGYPVDIIYDKLREIDSQISSAQTYYFEKDYKKLQISLEVIKQNLFDAEERLSTVQKEEQSFGDKVKDNLLFIGSLAAAVISIFTAYKLVNNSIDKQKLLDLHKKLTKKAPKAKYAKKIKANKVEEDKE